MLCDWSTHAMGRDHVVLERNAMESNGRKVSERIVATRNFKAQMIVNRCRSSLLGTSPMERSKKMDGLDSPYEFRVKLLDSCQDPSVVKTA